MLLALLLQAATPPAPPLAPGRPMPAATVMAEPVALAVAGWDADGDGRTSRAELQAGGARSFAAIDAAGRGDMSYIGFADWAEHWLGNRSALPSPFELDADQNDRISRAEFDAGLLRAFERLDADKDGAVSRAEMLTIRPGLREPERRDRDKKRRR